MKTKFFKFLTVCAFSFLFALFITSPVFAATTTGGQQTRTVQKDGVTFKVTYPADIRCGVTTTFKFETLGSDGLPIAGAIYRIHTLMVHDGSEYVSVYDVSWGTNGEYKAKDTFDFTFYASGTYYIRFNSFYKNADGTFDYMDTGAFANGIVLNISDPDYPSVEEITDTVAGECLNECTSDFEKAVWLNDWLADHCSYDYDYSYCSAEGALARGAGTCEAYHRAYVMLLNKVGVATGRITGNGHVWTAVRMDGKWYQVDPTWNDAGYTDPNLDLRHLYFGLNDEIMTTVHSDHRPTPGYESNSLDHNYFIRTGEISKWAAPQIETVRRHIAARETEFTIEIKDSYYADVLYSLVAHVLTNTSWSEEALKIELQAGYTPKRKADGTIDTQNGTLSCSVSYTEIPLQFKQVDLDADSVKVGNNARLSYAINRNANVTVQIFDNGGRCLKTLISNTAAGTDGKTVQWDLKDNSGGYVANGRYYFAVTATDNSGNRVTERKYFQVTGNNGGTGAGSGTGSGTGTGSETVTSPYDPVFNAEYYAGRYRDLYAVFGNDRQALLNHFLTFGMQEGRQGCAGFDVHSYYNAYADLRRAFGNDLKSYYMHYINYGRWEGRVATGCYALQGAVTVYNGVDYSLVYDYNDYVSRYADIWQIFGADDAGVLQHFVTYGMGEGRRGCAGFDVHSYRNAYADLRRAFGNDLKSYYMHYINYGKREMRSATGCYALQGAVTVYNGVDYSPVYDYNDYVSRHADIWQAFGADDMAVLQHFVTYGMREGRQAKDSFDIYKYRSRYPDLNMVFGDNLAAYYVHYLQYGIREGRRAD